MPGRTGVRDSRGAGPQVVTGPSSSCSRVMLSPCDSTQGSVISSLTLVTTRCAPMPAAASRSTQNATLFPWNRSSSDEARASPRRESMPESPSKRDSLDRADVGAPINNQPSLAW